MNYSKLYVLTKDLNIGFIDSICICDECIERGKVELTINYLNGMFMMQTTLDQILENEEIIMTSINLEEINEIKRSISKSNYYLCKYLEQRLLERN